MPAVITPASGHADARLCGWDTPLYASSSPSLEGAGHRHLGQHDRAGQQAGGLGAEQRRVHRRHEQRGPDEGEGERRAGLGSRQLGPVDDEQRPPSTPTPATGTTAMPVSRLRTSASSRSWRATRADIRALTFTGDSLATRAGAEGAGP